jgi:TATA-box binding protein (TBP) (component of TFIID and TFIIIB)
MVNVVATCSIACEHSLDLKDIALSLANTRYNPNCKFTSVVYIQPNTASKAIVFLYNNGKMVVNGAPSIVAAYAAACRVARSLHAELFTPSDTVLNFNVVNRVYTGSFGIRIRLDKLAHHLTNATYEPELFCGLTYSFARSARMLLLSSGTFVLTGLRDGDDDECAMHAYMSNTLSSLPSCTY